MRICYVNYFDDYAITASSANSNYPADNVKDTRTVKVWRSTGVNPEYLSIDAGAGNTLTPTFACIINHNLTSSAVIRIQGDDDSAFGSPGVNELLTWSASTISKFWTGVAFRYWRLYLTDATNTDLYLSIGRLYLGTHVQVTNAQEIGFEEEWIDTSTYKQSKTGQHYANKGILLRRYNLTFPYWDSTMKTTIQTFHEATMMAEKLIMIPDENNLATWPALYCFLDQQISYKHIFNKTFSSKISFTECK